MVAIHTSNNSNYDAEVRNPILNPQEFAINKQSSSMLFVKDNFFLDPLAIRKQGLQAKYQLDPMSGFPGYRSVISDPSPIKNEIESIIGAQIESFFAGYQFTTEGADEFSSIHPDNYDFAGVIYLNTDVDGMPGTSLFRHREFGIEVAVFSPSEMEEQAKKLGLSTIEVQERLKYDGLDISKWDRMVTCPMKFNRLFLYNANWFHRNESSWGKTPHDSRLVLSIMGRVKSGEKKPGYS